MLHAYEGPSVDPDGRAVALTQLVGTDGVTAWRGTLISCGPDYASVRCARSSLLLRFAASAAACSRRAGRCATARGNPRPAPRAPQLEQAGATIRAIHITVDNVFDPSNPAEDKALYRWANSVHVLTRETRRRRTSCCSPRETRFVARCSTSRRARCARAASSPRPRSSRAATTRQRTASTSTCTIRDSWSLALDSEAEPQRRADRMGHRALRQQLARHRQDARDRLRERDRSRRSATRLLRRQRVRQPRAAFEACSRTPATAIGASSPSNGRFYSLDTRWSLGGSIHDEERVDTMYDLGEEIDEFGHDIDAMSVQGGWSRGFVGQRAHRWLFGVTSEEHTFRATPDVPQPLLLPPDRKLVYPWLGWQWVEDDYREMSELNDMGRTEDVSLGTNVFASVGFAKRRFGSDRDATLFRVHRPRRAGSPAGPAACCCLEAGASTRRRGRWATAIPTSTSPGDYYHRNLGNHLFSVSLERTRHRRPGPREPGAARRRQRLARLSDPLPSRREPHGPERRAALLHGVLSVAVVPRRLGRVRRCRSRSAAAIRGQARAWAHSTTSARACA